MKVVGITSPKEALSSPKTSRKRVYQEIKKAIVNGTIGFDMRLSEESFAKLFCVSRTPIREAIFQLVQEGLVTKKDNSHFYVKRPTEEELDEIAEVRIVLQGMLIDRLIDKSDDSLVMELEQNVERSKKFLAARRYAWLELYAFRLSPDSTFSRKNRLHWENSEWDGGPRTAQSSYSYEICRNSAPACFRP